MTTKETTTNNAALDAALCVVASWGNNVYVAPEIWSNKGYNHNDKVVIEVLWDADREVIRYRTPLTDWQWIDAK